MRWPACAIAVVLALLAAHVTGQQTYPTTVTIEPDRVTVGDRITLTIAVEHPSDVALSVPDDPEAFDPLDVIDVREPATQELSGGRSETTFEYVLAAFLIGEVELEPIIITADGADARRVKPEPIIVESVVPPDAVAQFRDLKPPLVASTGPPTWTWAALMMAAFAGLSVFTMVLARVPALSPPSAPVAEPVEHEDGDAETLVMRELAELEESGLLERGELAVFYGRLGESLRHYLANRYELPVVAMTPGEIERRLDETSMSRLAVRQAVSTLEQCQAVQFAGYAPARERAEADLGAAREIVRLTSDVEAGG